MKHLQSQADRLNAHAFSQGQHDRDEQGQSHRLLKFGLEKPGHEGCQDSPGNVAKQPGKPIAKSSEGRGLPGLGDMHADQLEEVVTHSRHFA